MAYMALISYTHIVDAPRHAGLISQCARSVLHESLSRILTTCSERVSMQERCICSNRRRSHQQAMIWTVGCFENEVYTLFFSALTRHFLEIGYTCCDQAILVA